MLHILLPTDFSDNATNAIHYAIQLFKEEDCTFYILHVYGNEVYDHSASTTKATLSDLKKEASKESQVELYKTLKHILKTFKNSKHQFKTISSFNTIVEEVSQIVDNNNIDLIVMGSSGITANRDLPFGSYTVLAMKYVHCPVLVIPLDYQFKEIKEILFPTDLKVKNKPRELKLLSHIAKRQLAMVRILSIAEYDKLSVAQDNNKEFIREYLGKLNVEFDRIDDDEVTDGINMFIVQKNTDLLVLVNTRNSFLEHILFRESVLKLGLHLQTPFLVLQNINR